MLPNLSQTAAATGSEGSMCRNCTPRSLVFVASSITQLIQPRNSRYRSYEPLVSQEPSLFSKTTLQSPHLIPALPSLRRPTPRRVASFTKQRGD